MKISAILLAAGSGERLKSSTSKAFVKIGGREMFLHSLEIFENQREIHEIILVVPKTKIRETKKLIVSFKKVKKIVSGGKTRMESLQNGLKFTTSEWILSQNAANPFINSKEISRCLKLIPKWKAVGVGHKSVSTLRFDGKIIPREKVWLMETPQIVAKKVLYAGLQFAERNKIKVTDELQLAELVGEKVKVIAASANNFKITRPEDLSSESRVGFGHDSHKFSKKKKPLILGGVRIAPTGGLQANSDGDVILHALTNAISTALGGGSLSTFSDAMCRRGIKDSKKYLAVVLAKMKLENFEIENLSISIEGKKPKLEKHFYKICQSLSKILLLEGSRIGLVATTGEGLTSFGRGEGLQVFAVILLKK